MNFAYKKFIIPILTGIFLLLACLLQSKLLLSGDVGYLMHAANQLLLGGKYGEDFFETNPPMILYLYMPAVLLAKYSFFSVIASVRLYVCSLGLVSVLFSTYLLKKIISDEDFFLKLALFCGILIILFILPISSFAQREHFLIIFSLPYLFISVARLMDRPIHPGVAFLIGCIASLGFSLKPYFLAPLCLIELYFIYKKKHLLAWIRLESLTVLTMLILYLISILIFEPEYFKIVLPMVNQFYLPFVREPLGSVMFSWTFMPFILAMILAYPFFWKYDRYPSFGILLFLSLIGMWLAVVLSGAYWFYHQIPEISLAFLMFFYYSGHIFSGYKNKNLKKIDVLFLCFAKGLILLFPVLLWAKITIVLLTEYTVTAINPMINYFAKKTGNHTITCFALNSLECFPLVYHIDGNYTGRYPLLWWYRGLREIENHSTVNVDLAKDNLINGLASDLNRYQTRWIILDKKAFKLDLMDPITYLSQNKKFKEAFSHYSLRATIRDREIYERNTAL